MRMFEACHVGVPHLIRWLLAQCVQCFFRVLPRRQGHDDFPFSFGHWLNRQPASLAEQLHAGELGDFFQSW